MKRNRQQIRSTLPSDRKRKGENGMGIDRRTDLAIEIRESFPEDDVEVSGVSLEEKTYCGDRIRVTTVGILNDAGARQMGKPKGNYITIEWTWKNQWEYGDIEPEVRERTAKEIAGALEKLTPLPEKEHTPVYLIAGLGNRYATPDALGPIVVEDVQVTRHLIREFGEDILEKKEAASCVIIPGVMGQTGMETREILGGIQKHVQPDAVLVIDSLASRSVGRLCSTIQITDTGISPGAGIGNNRNTLNADTLGVPVIAIGVPTVVDAVTIVSECIEENFRKQGFTSQETESFLRGISGESMQDLFVTPKDIDAHLRVIGGVVTEGINRFLKK